MTKIKSQERQASESLSSFCLTHKNVLSNIFLKISHTHITYIKKQNIHTKEKKINHTFSLKNIIITMKENEFFFFRLAECK